MRILIYEPTPDIVRSDLWISFAHAYAKEGHDVFLLSDEETYYHARNGNREPHRVDCTNILKWKIASSGLPFYATPKCRKLRKCFDKDPWGTFSSIDEYRLSQYCNVLSAYKPDKIVIWNGLTPQHQAFRRFCKEHYPELSYEFMEAGWLPQKGTYYSDPLGVNGASRLALTNPPEINEQESHWVERFKSNYRISTGNYPVQNMGYILVPLQLETDTNITQFSPFSSMSELLKWISEKTPKSQTVVVRPHPLDPHAAKLLPTYGRRFIIDSETPLHKLIAGASAIIGINSTVLIESLAFDKPIFACGNGVFDKSNAIKRPDFNRQILEQPIDFDVDLLENRKLIHYLATLQKTIPKENLDNVKYYPLSNGLIPQTRYSLASNLISKYSIKLKLALNCIPSKISRAKSRIFS